MQQMMKRIVFSAILLTLLLATSLAGAQGEPKAGPASQSNMKVIVSIAKPDAFWNYTFLPKDGSPAKPAAVKVVWTVGDLPTGEKSALICSPGKTDGQVVITTDKGIPLNISTLVFDARGKALGSISLQVLNKGQVETISIAPPEVTEPTFTWGNS